LDPTPVPRADFENDIDFQFQTRMLAGMLICHCNGVSDRTVRRVIRQGARSVSDVGHACGAGTCCQGCSHQIAKIIHAEHRTHSKSAPLPMADKRGAAAP
jgi:bacterioferritin-associated ferredoxin